jgi:hypothetical protein
VTILVYVTEDIVETMLSNDIILTPAGDADGRFAPIDNLALKITDIYTIA